MIESSSKTESIQEAQIRPLTPGDWALVEALFGSKGACGGCWCMYWRVPHGGKEFEALRGAPAKSALRGLIEKNKVFALIALEGSEPVGWICLGPTEDFPRLNSVKALAHEREAGTWAIVCLYLRPKARRQGIGTRLIEGACDFAFRRGVRGIEGYPVNVRPDSTMPGAFAWTGVPAMFEKAGFARLERSIETRSIWQARTGQS